MSDSIEILKARKPEIAAFLENWRQRHEDRAFDLKDNVQQAEFYEAVVVMAKHLAHTSKSVTLKTITSVDGVTTVYINVTPS